MPVLTGFQVSFDVKKAERIREIRRRQRRALKSVQSPRYEKLKRAISGVAVTPREAAKAEAKATVHVAARRKAVASRRSEETTKHLEAYEKLSRHRLALVREELKNRSFRTPETILLEARDRSRRSKAIHDRRRPATIMKTLGTRLIVETRPTTLPHLTRTVSKLFHIPAGQDLKDFGLTVTTLYRNIATDRIFVIELGLPRSSARHEIYNIAFALRRSRQFTSVMPERIFSELFATVQPDDHPEVRRQTLWHIGDDVNDMDIRVRAAWGLDPPPGGRRLGERVVVGHLDTGWRSHDQYDQDRIDRDRSHNAISGQTGGHNAVHELPPHYNPNVTHGTATGSAIASEQDPASLATIVANPNPERGAIATNEVSVGGIAPGVTVIPIKCVDDVTGVARIADIHLARAMEYAIDCDVDVISISLGGIQHPALEEAIERAIEAGIIIVAAAGQSYYVVNVFDPHDSVVQPASHPDVIAVAGSTEKRLPWGESHRGPNADIAAPATGVWIADFDPEDESEVAIAGFGTSFSTAITAGAAALWVGFWGKQTLREKYQDANTPIAHVFHEVLRQSADNREGNEHRLTGDWNTNLYGAGILNVERLLATALPDTVPPPRTEAGNLLGIIGDIGAGIDQGLRDTRNFVEDLAMDSAELAQNLATSAVLWAQAETDSAIALVEEEYRRALAAVDAAVGQTRALAEQSVALVENVLDELVETGEELVEEAAETAEDLVEAASDMVEEGADTTGEAVEDVMDWWNGLWDADDDD
jgi:hypothetical protein